MAMQASTLQIYIIFCNHTLWDSPDGFHLFDYSVDLSERGLTSDRGFNSNIMYENDEKNAIIQKLVIDKR